jgi:hypothetical protein
VRHGGVRIRTSGEPPGLMAMTAPTVWRIGMDACFSEHTWRTSHLGRTDSGDAVVCA